MSIRDLRLDTLTVLVAFFMCGCVGQQFEQEASNIYQDTPEPMVYVVKETIPYSINLDNILPKLLSVSADWFYRKIQINEDSVTTNTLSEYGRKISFRKEPIGYVADIEFFQIHEYPNWKSPRPWISGGFPYYFRLIISTDDLSVLDSYTSRM